MTGRERLLAALSPEQLRRHKLSHDAVEWLGDVQGCRCAICGREDRELVVDHCHGHGGEVRGLLCRPCNSAIGQLGDDAPGVMRAVLYLAQPPLSLRRQLGTPDGAPSWLHAAARKLSAYTYPAERFRCCYRTRADGHSRSCQHRNDAA